jgi:hypothetical protein
MLLQEDLSHPSHSSAWNHFNNLVACGLHTLDDVLNEDWIKHRMVRSHRSAVTITVTIVLVAIGVGRRTQKHPSNGIKIHKPKQMEWGKSSHLRRA